MKDYMIEEIVHHYHKLSIPDDLDIEEVLNVIRLRKNEYSEDMTEAMETLQLEDIEFYKDFCGVDAVEINAIEEI